MIKPVDNNIISTPDMNSFANNISDILFAITIKLNDIIDVVNELKKKED